MRGQIACTSKKHGFSLVSAQRGLTSTLMVGETVCADKEKKES
jgi:hypothetical protein